MVALLGDGTEGPRLKRMSYHTIAHDDDIGLAYAKDCLDDNDMTRIMAPHMHAPSRPTASSAKLLEEAHYPRSRNELRLPKLSDSDAASVQIDSPPRHVGSAAASLYDSPERAASERQANRPQQTMGVGTSNVTIYSAYEGF